MQTKEAAQRKVTEERVAFQAIDPPGGRPASTEQDDLAHALSGVLERIAIYAPPFRRKVLEAAMAETRDILAPAAELIAMEGRVREILSRLPIKARAAFETILRVYVVEGMGLEIDWGCGIVNEGWKNLQAIQQARRELADDPDVQVLAQVCRLAAAIDGEDFPEIDPAAPAAAVAEPSEGMDIMEAIDALNAMEPEIRALVTGLDVRTRAIVGMLSRLFTIESYVGGCEWTAALYNQVMEDEAAIERGCRELPDDPAVKTLRRAHGLVRRLEESEEGGIAAGDNAVQRGAHELVAVLSKGRVPSYAEEMIEKLRGLADLFAAMDTPEGEAACAAAIRPLRDRVPFQKSEVRDILAVLRKYPAKERAAVLSAAACQARATARAATKLGQMEGRFAAAIAGLDDRTKAVLRIARDVGRADGYINSRFTDTWQEVVEEAPVDALRQRPEFAELLAVFDQCGLLHELAQ